MISPRLCRVGARAGRLIVAVFPVISLPASFSAAAVPAPRLHIACEQFSKIGPDWRVGGNGQPVVGAQGLISDLHVFDRPLAAAQMAALHRTGKPDTDSAGAESARGLAVTFETSAAGATSIAVYDRQGAQLRELVIGENLKAGKHTIHWDGRDRAGKLLPVDTYELRGAVANLKATYEFSVGNTGQPPWDWEHNLHGGVYVDVARGPDGSFYVCNHTGEGNRHMQRLDASGQVIWTSPTEPSSGPELACTADDKYFYVVTTVDIEIDAATQYRRPREVVWRLAAETGQLVPWPAGNALAVNATRDVSEPGISPFRWWMALQKVPPRLNGVRGLAAGAGRLYVSLFFEDAIAVYDRDTGQPLGRIDGIARPRGIALGPNNTLYAVSSNAVVRLSLEGQDRTVVAAGLDDPCDVAVDGNGMIYVSDLGSRHQVRRFDARGQELKPLGVNGGGTAGGRVAPDKFIDPLGLAVDSRDQILVADFGNGRCQRFTPEGKCTLSVMAAGFGGNNGGVAAMPGEPERFFTSILTEIGRCLTEYKVDYRRREWQRIRQWPSIAPFHAVEPLFIRKLNGRAYVFLVAKNIVVAELRGDRVEFCAALVTSAFDLDSVLWEGVRADVRQLGLLDERNKFNCRFVWTDKNRDQRMQADEVVRWPAQGFYSVNDGDVDAHGNMVLHDHYTASIVRIPLLGFDDRGNPLYRWDRLETLWSHRQPPRYDTDTGYWANELRLMATRIDADANVYLSDVPGANWMDPDRVSLRKYAPGGRLLWDVGRKARGLKDKPGEFKTVSSFCGIHHGLLFVNEFEGQLDVYTTDGLYAATLLENATWGRPGPYRNWGENFFSTIFRHPKTGRDYAYINTHNFHFPCYRIDGLNEIKRFRAAVELTEDWRQRLAQRSATPTTDDHAQPTAKQVMRLARLSAPPQIDGNLDEWTWRAPAIAAIEEAEAKAGAQAWAGYDAANLYLAFDVTDNSPALNQADPGALWAGDALELYLSTNPDRLTNTGAMAAGDYVIHLACTPEDKRPRLEVRLPVAGRTWVPKDARVAVVRRAQGDGYRVEAALPWKSLQEGWQPRPGSRCAWDWNVNYSAPAGSASVFKALWTPETLGANWRGTQAWDHGEFEAFDRVVPTPEPLHLVVDDAAGQYAAEAGLAWDANALRLRFAVRDPNPGLSEGAAPNVFFSGDAIGVTVGPPGRPRPLIIVAHRGAKTGVYDPGTHLRPPGSTASLKPWPDGTGYDLEAAIPWSAVGVTNAVADETILFGWRVSWSDALGGESVFERAWADGAAIEFRLGRAGD